jgi:hypothetical protein
VVRVRVTCDQQVDGLDVECLQLTYDPCRASCIDERRLSAFADYDCVALAYIKEAKLELLRSDWQRQKQD